MPSFRAFRATFSGSQERYQQAVASKTTSSAADNTNSDSDTTTSSTISALQAQLSQLQEELAEKSALLEESKKGGEGGGSAKSETKLLKMKAQMTSRIKSLEKDLADLRQVSSYSFLYVWT